MPRRSVARLRAGRGDDGQRPQIAIMAAAAEALREIQDNSSQIPIVCPGHSREINNIKFSKETDDGVFMASGCSDKMPMLRHGDAYSPSEDEAAAGVQGWGIGDWIGTWQGHRGAVWTATIDPNCFVAATASADCSVKVWNATTGEEKAALLHRSVVKTVSLTDDAEKCVSGGYEGLLRVWDLGRPDQELSSFPLLPDGKKVRITHALWDGPEGTTVLVGAEDNGLRRFDTRTGAMVQEVTMPGSVQDVEQSAACNLLTVAAGNVVSFLDPKSLEVQKAHEMPSIHFRDEGGASLHPSGDRFVAGGSDLWVRVFDFQTGEQLELNKGHHGPVRCLRYTPDGRHYATGSEDGTIRVWVTAPEETLAEAK